MDRQRSAPQQLLHCAVWCFVARQVPSVLLVPLTRENCVNPTRDKDLSPTGAALLGLLALRPWTTYELATQAKRSLRWFWPRAERKLYAEPKLLVDQGLATSTERATGNRKSTVYAITRKGRAELRRWLAEEGKQPTFESEELLRVFFADSGAGADLAATIERIRSRAVASMTELAEIGATPDGVDQVITDRARVNALSFAMVFGVHRSIADWGAWAGDTLAAWDREDPAPSTLPVDVFTDAVELARRYGGDPRRDETAANPTLLLVVAHPDDETFGCGSLLADARERGARVVVCCATRGEAGEDATGAASSAVALAEHREAELRHAAGILGVDEVEILGFADSGWDGPAPAGSLVKVGPRVLTAAVEDVLVRHRPDVVVTLDPTGSDGHRDHAAIGSTTTEAFRRRVTWSASLYHWCLPRSLMQAWSRHTAEANPDSVYLETELGRADEDITTRTVYGHLLGKRRAAIAAHATQASPFADLPEDLEAAFLGEDHLVRIVPPWDGGPPEANLVGLPAQRAARRSA
jgi:LmbE family N-acetylglucosaminyl deacetylase/DNA-binding PadR family transcriptional regulator